MIYDNFKRLFINEYINYEAYLDSEEEDYMNFFEGIAQFSDKNGCDYYVLDYTDVPGFSCDFVRIACYSISDGWEMFIVPVGEEQKWEEYLENFYFEVDGLPLLPCILDDTTSMYFG